jgi:zinc protease
MRTKVAALILTITALVICGFTQNSGLKLIAEKAKTSQTSTPTSAPPNEIDIPYTRFVLNNGLTVIVHEDHKAPIVAVNMWYHVGSKNEKPGKTGFAHLFEHLMFGGSEHAPGPLHRNYGKNRRDRFERHDQS